MYHCEGSYHQGVRLIGPGITQAKIVVERYSYGPEHGFRIGQIKKEVPVCPDCESVDEWIKQQQATFSPGDIQVFLQELKAKQVAIEQKQRERQKKNKEDKKRKDKKNGG